MGAPNAGCGLKKVKSAVDMGFDEFGMGDAGDEAKRCDDPLVDLPEAARIARFPVECTRAEDAALVHGRHAVFIGCAEDCFSVPSDALDMKDTSRDEALEEVVGLDVAEFVKDGP